jgi:hypothetical protein
MEERYNGATPQRRKMSKVQVAKLRNLIHLVLHACNSTDLQDLQDLLTGTSKQIQCISCYYS